MFSAAHEEYRQYVRDFAARELRPHTREWDEAGELPREAIRAMGRAGILGVIGPKALGGEERDYVSLGIAIEEVAAADISCAMIAWIQATVSRFSSFDDSISSLAVANSALSRSSWPRRASSR